MAVDWYIDVNATNNGDGTASGQAASPGATGAYNNLMAVLTDRTTYSAIAAGDRVWVRCDNGAGGNAGVTLATGGTIMNAVGTSTNYVNVIFDSAGVTSGWSAGVMTLTHNTSIDFTFASYCRVVANTRAGLVWSAAFTSHQTNWVGVSSAIIENVKFSQTNDNASADADITLSGSANLKFINCDFEMGLSSTWFEASFNSRYEFFGCTFTVLQSRTSSSFALMNINVGANIIIRFFGCDFTGLGDLNGGTVASESGTGTLTIEYEDCKVHPQWDWSSNPNSNTASNSSQSLRSGTDPYDIVYQAPRGLATFFKGDVGYPYLSALLPDGTTPWSLRCSPITSADMTDCFYSPTLAKKFNDTAAAKTIRLNLCISGTFLDYTGSPKTVNDPPLKQEWWIEGTYVDNSTGDVKHFNSIGPGVVLASSLDTSTAAWTPLNGDGNVFYGSVELIRYKIEATTPTSIKPGTLVTVVLRTTVGRTVYASDIFYVDPEFEMV